MFEVLFWRPLNQRSCSVYENVCLILLWTCTWNDCSCSVLC